jgi:ACS family glucarate transporter-like MFS transporter
VGYTLFQIPSGWLADRAEVRNIFLLLCSGWMLLTAFTAVVGRPGASLPMALPLLWVVRGLFGVVAAPTYPAAGRAIAVTVAPRLQARANSLVLSSVGVGSALAPVLLAPAANRYGWRAALGIAAALTLGAGILWGMLAPRVGRARTRTAYAEKEHFATREESPGVQGQPLRKRSFWFLSASYFLQGYLGYIFVFWFYLYLVQVRHFQVLNAAWLATLPWVATMFAIPVGGFLSDAALARWGATWGRRSVPMLALSAGAAFLVIGARTASGGVAVASLTACTALVLCTEGPYWATMTQLSGQRSGIAGGTMNFGSNLGGMISPTLTPWLAERMEWESALALTAGLAVVAGLLWLGVRVEPAES